MKTIQYFILVLSLLSGSRGFTQKEFSGRVNTPTNVRLLSIEPALGIHTNFGTDFLMTTLVQWNPVNHLSLVSHTSFNINNITQRSFNGVKTNYNYSINQKFGMGTSLFGKKVTHTLLLMVGAKYTAYKETLIDERFENVSSTVKSLSPDYGLMYSRKRGWKKYFYTCRMYVPLYPWPIKGVNILYSDNNMDNIALEFGVGMKIL